MIQNHRQFIAAITEKKMIRVRFHSGSRHGVIDRICAPLDFGPETEAPEEPSRYWIWNTSETENAPSPLGLLDKQILSVNVLPKSFDPTEFGDVYREWSVPRCWHAPVESSRALAEA